MMKYIRFKNLSVNGDKILPFPVDLLHEDYCEAITDKYNYAEPVSAGFVTDDGVCSGEAKALNLKARIKEDTELLAQELR